jgi:hypothetical protein
VPQIWLAHLSDTNNRPDLAEQDVRSALALRDLDLPVTALPRTAPGPIWSPTAARGSSPWRPPSLSGESTQLGFDNRLF